MGGVRVAGVDLAARIAVVCGAVVEVVLDHTDTTPDTAWLASPAVAARSGVKVDQGYFLDSLGEPAQGQIIAISRAENHDPRTRAALRDHSTRPAHR
jgi:hypothetical protein